MSDENTRIHNWQYHCAFFWEIRQIIAFQHLIKLQSLGVQQAKPLLCLSHAKVIPHLTPICLIRGKKSHEPIFKHTSAHRHIFVHTRMQLKTVTKYIHRVYQWRDTLNTSVSLRLCALKREKTIWLINKTTINGKVGMMLYRIASPIEKLS